MFFDLERETFRICQKNFPVSRGNFSEKIVFFLRIKLFWRSFLDIEQNFFGFCHKNFGGVVETAFYCPEELIEQFFSEKRVSYIFPHIKRESINLLAKFLLQGFQNCLPPVPGITLSFVGKKAPLLSFWDIERNFFSFLFNKLRRVCQNYFSPSRGPFWEKLIFSEKEFLNHLRTFSAKVSTSCEFILAALSKRLPKGQGGNFQK